MQRYDPLRPEPAPPAAQMAEHYVCDVCHAMTNLSTQPMASLECDCCVCPTCATEHIKALMRPRSVQLAAPSLGVGEHALYRDRHGNLVQAVVVQVDRSIQPPQYGIRLAGAAADEIRFTEQSRLLPGTASIQPGVCGDQLAARWTAGQLQRRETMLCSFLVAFRTARHPLPQVSHGGAAASAGTPVPRHTAAAGGAADKRVAACTRRHQVRMWRCRLGCCRELTLSCWAVMWHSS